MLKYFLIITIIITFTLISFFIGRNSLNLSSKTETKSNQTSDISTLLKIIEDKQIKLIKSWEDEDGKKHIGIISQLDKPLEKDSVLSTSEQLNIYDKTGKSVYELRDFVINNFKFSNSKSSFKKLIIETNGGGTDNFLNVLDYENGRFIELEDVGLETQVRGGWWTMPEYRSSAKGAYFKPVQLIVIQQIGGAENDPKAAVFRNKNGKFQKVGEISMNKLGDSIDRQLSENEKDKQK